MDEYRPNRGLPIQELETPCLIVDLDALEHNYNHISETYRTGTTKMRQHVKDIKTPELAHMQIKAGGTVGGVCAAKVSEAEVMVESGISDVFITNQIVTQDKIARLCSLTQRANIKVCVDNPTNLRELSQAAEAMGGTIGVLVEVDTSMHRAGVRSITEGVQLAKLASNLPGIHFKGVMSHQAISGNPDKETRLIEGRKFIQMCLDVRDAIEKEGIPVEMVSSGETFTYDVAPDMPGVTEVEGGTYALMSTAYSYLPEFQIAVKILGTIVSTPQSDISVGDVGRRALASPNGVLPSLEGLPTVRVSELQDNHIVFRSNGPMPLTVGDRFLLHSGQQDILVNRWDQFVAVRRGFVECVWQILARGCHN